MPAMLASTSDQSWSKADPRGEIVAALAPWRQRLESLNVDSAGIGYYLGKHLDDLDFPVRLVNVGQSSSDGDKYANKKAEFYWGLRMRFQAGEVAGLTDERTISQLAASSTSTMRAAVSPSRAKTMRASAV